jgi:phosphatidylethanolamine/phosphatidyl-N-methylethanolamine N-methyltransferase
MAMLERAFAPAAELLGWHPDFDKARVLGAPGLAVEGEETFPPLGLFTFLRMRKAA